MSSTRLFVTGTDTGVGKTFVAGALARALDVPIVKPVLSGLAEPGPSDLEQLERLSGRAPLCFQRWQTPVSPHRAAVLEGAPLDQQGFLRFLDELPASCVVEGAGGWRVPLAPGLEIPDVARRVEGKVWIVAADRLGVLNHTRLTVEAVQRDGLVVAGVALNALGRDASTPHNLDDLRALLEVPVRRFPYLDSGDPGAIRAAGAALIEGIC